MGVRVGVMVTEGVGVWGLGWGVFGGVAAASACRLRISSCQWGRSVADAPQRPGTSADSHWPPHQSLL